jgi:hypothetical protein
MMFIRSIADSDGTPWAAQVTVGAITVTAEATSSLERHDKQGSGAFFLATNGYIHLAAIGDFHMATDSVKVPPYLIAHRAPNGAKLATRGGGSFSKLAGSAVTVGGLSEACRSTSFS